MSGKKHKTSIRKATLDDITALLAIETRCFSGDRLSRRSFRHHLQSTHSDLLVAEVGSDQSAQLIGYGLSLRHSGTRLARLYSLAVLPEARGQGLSRQLLDALEQAADDHERLFMRLEVAKTNRAAIALYESAGYRIFGEYCDYYEDHSDALRMQKTIRHVRSAGINRLTPWYQQTTEFTCGPAALMMAMASLDSRSQCQQTTELDIWREATTVFMTSGHGGCHPLGLALAAQRRGFVAQAWVNSKQPLFLDGVRSDQKKHIMTVVHNQFVAACKQKELPVFHRDVTQHQLEKWLRKGCAVVVLVSSYRFDGKKAPHWMVLTGIDDSCLYVHEPHPDELRQRPIDCQYMPIAREDFDRMSAFGNSRLRSAIVISLPTAAEAAGKTRRKQH